MNKLIGNYRFIRQKVVAEFQRGRRKVRLAVAPILNRLEYKNHQRHFRSSDDAKHFQEGENTFILYRVIGNALPPRHDPKQILENLKFQLDNEQSFAGCTKYWVINRIFDRDARLAAIELLDRYSQQYFEIPFDLEEYAAVSVYDDAQKVSELLKQIENPDSDMLERAELAKLRLKRLYIMNNNGARNAAIEHGRSRAKWILPWDGNCFLTPMGWKRISEGVAASDHLPYHLVSMARLEDNATALQETAAPSAQEEPQIVFHRDSKDLFDENIPYGRRPKIELLNRLGLWGHWKAWQNDPWDVGTENSSRFKHAYRMSTGWVYRLSSGKPKLEVGENADKHRMLNRNRAIIDAVAFVDRAIEKKSAGDMD